MTSGEYKRMSDLIENGDADTQKEINLWLLYKLKEIGEILDRQAVINTLNRVANNQLERYIESVASNVALCVRADMIANGLAVTHVRPDRYEHKEENNDDAAN